MIDSKNKLRFYIAADRIMAGYSPFPDIKTKIKELIFPNPIITYLKSMRYVSYYTNKQITYSVKTVWHKLKFHRLGIKLGFSIGHSVFGYGLLIPHYGTIVVNGQAKAGNFCVLHTSTCIGGGTIRIGDALYLSAGAKIFVTRGGELRTIFPFQLNL